MVLIKTLLWDFALIGFKWLASVAKVFQLVSAFHAILVSIYGSCPYYHECDVQVRLK